MAEFTSKNKYGVNVKEDGVYYRLSTEAKPSSVDGVENANKLFLIDTQQVFIYYKGVWREI